MRRENEASLQQAFHVAPKSLRKLASNPGWIDQDIVTIRKMNAAGARVADIAAALGWTCDRVKGRMKRDGIVLRNRTGNGAGWERSKSAKQDHLKHGRGVWHEKARQLRAAGLKNRQIAAILGFSPHKVAHFFSAERRRRIAEMGKAA